MRYINRPTLSERTERLFRKRRAVIIGDVDPKARASKSWDNKGAAGDLEARSKLAAMAGPLARCMYCEDSEGVDVDHFAPKSSYPEKTFEWPNLLLACSHCNSNSKRSAFPLSPGGWPQLIDPTSQNPMRHLTFSPTTGKFLARDARGIASLKVYGLERVMLETHRRSTVIAIFALVVAYDDCMVQGRTTAADRVRRTIRRIPHQSVVDWVFDVARGPGFAVLEPRVAAVIRARPDL